MNILVVVDDYMPSSTKVAAKMMHELAVELVRIGHSVTVLTPNNSGNPKSVFMLDGVRVYSFTSGKIKNTHKIIRAVNETLLSFRAWQHFKKEFKKERYDYIIFYSPSIFFGMLVKKLKKLWSVKAYLVLRDFFPQWAIDSGLLRENSIITKYFKYFEQINYEAADVIGIQPQKNILRFDNMNKRTYNCELLYNWADTKNIHADVKCSYYRDLLGLKNKTIFFYGGNLGHAQDVGNMLRLAENMSIYDDAHFLFVGDGDEAKLIELAIGEKGLKNITFLSSVSQDEFKKILLEIDIGLFSLHYAHTTDNFPGKILGYMANKIPILGSVNIGNELLDVINESGGGMVTVNPDDKAFFDNAVFLYQNPDDRGQMGVKAHELLAKLFSVESAATQILKYAANNQSGK